VCLCVCVRLCVCVYVVLVISTQLGVLPLVRCMGAALGVAIDIKSPLSEKSI
jgi:hypothetical protein